MLLSPELCVAALQAASPEAVIDALAARLLARGHVKESFAAAALAREKRSPTGLPFDPPAVALPHAEPEHVVAPAIAIASLAAPVAFREMGSPSSRVEVSLVVMPALTAKEQAAAGLSQLIELLQDDELRATLAAATSPADMCRALEGRWTL